MHWHRMPNTLRTNPNHLRSVPIQNLSISALWSIRNVLAESHTMQSRPLLQLLAQIRNLDQRVCRAMPSHHPWIRTTVSRIHSSHLRDPFFLRLDDLAVRTLGVCAQGAGAWTACKTASCDARVAGSCCNEVGVRRHEHVGHHAARASARGKDFGWIGVVLLDGVFDHGAEALVITAGVSGETFDSVDFPAVAIFLGRRENRDEAFLFGQSIVLCR